jgi:WD40 repeat protein
MINLDKFRQKKTHTDTIASITYSPSGNYLATADRSGKITLWEPGRPRTMRSVSTPFVPLTGIWFGEDESCLLAGCQPGQLLVYHLPDLQIQGQMRLDTHRTGTDQLLQGTTPVLDWVFFAASPARENFLYAALEFCDFFTVRREDLHVEDHTHIARNPICCAAGSFDGQFLFLGDELGYVDRFHNTEKKLKTFAAHEEEVKAFDRDLRPTRMKTMIGIAGLALSPDQKLLASTSRSGGVHIWDTGSAKEGSEPSLTKEPLFSKAPLETGWMRGACFLPGQESLLLGTDDGKIHLWEYRLGSATLWAQVTEGIRDIAASPDGTQVAVGTEDGNLFIAPAPGAQQKTPSDQPSSGWLHKVFGKK